jgi:hypothetical protein
MDKHYVYSARTTEAGLALLNKTKGDMSWDKFISDAVAAHYNLDIGVIALPPSKFLQEQAERKAAREAEKSARAAKREAEKKAKEEAKKTSEKASRKGKAATEPAPKVEKPKVTKTARVAAVKGAGVKGTKKPALVS